MNLCAGCNRNLIEETICYRCKKRLIDALTECPQLAIEAGNCLTPLKGDSASGGGERSLGISVASLDFNMGNDLLPTFWVREKMVRKGLNLTLPALLNKGKTRLDDIKTSCDFLLTHLEYIIKLDWLQEFYLEAIELHGKGLLAARRDKIKSTRIQCPGTIGEEEPCLSNLYLLEDLDSEIICKKCKTKWNAARLVAVKISDRSQRWLIDIEAAAGFFNLSESMLRKLIKKHKIEKVNGLYSVHDLIDMRAKTHVA
jgi:hypothetical protein